MQRYSAVSGVTSGAVGGPSARDNTRADSSFAVSNFSLNQRRQAHLASYKLKCDKEPLNNRLGPPEFYPQSPSCPEETLTRESLQHGYKETVDGLEEAREILLSEHRNLTKPVILKCKEAIRKRHRAINESRAQRRKAGQVYGSPLSGSLLSKPCTFPEQRPCSEDSRKKWIEALSQQHKRLRLLADHVPHGYRRKSLFEVLIKQNVPLLRATWFIKVTYLNQVRPGSTCVSPGAPDKTQLARSELWTKDVVEYLQYLLDEFFAKDGSIAATQRRDQSSQMFLAGSVQNRGDSASAVHDVEGPSVHFKWWYMVRILQWHHAEGLLIPSYIIDWVLQQLQEKESLDTLQLLLPIISSLMESIALSQTYARGFVELAFGYIQDPSLGMSSLADNSRKAYTISALTEMLKYLIVAVPDTIVDLDCFPVPSCILSDPLGGTSYLSKVGEGEEKAQCGSLDFANIFGGKGRDARSQFLSLNHVVSSIKKRADNLSNAVNPGVQGHGVANAVQALDKALLLGDVRGAYDVLFEDLYSGGVEEGWIAEVSPCLQSSLKWIGTVSTSLVCSVFSICEWATCNFRDCRSALPVDLKLTGTSDFSQVHMAVILLKLKLEDMCSSSLPAKTNRPLHINSIAKSTSQHGILSGGRAAENASYPEKSSKTFGEDPESSESFRSPGAFHDILVCWIDQHEVEKGAGCSRLLLLIMELILSGIFHPQAYVRQLIISGIMDRNTTPRDLERQKRHYRILKHLPGYCLRDALDGTSVSALMSLETIRVYSNERHLILHGFLSGRSVRSTKESNAIRASKKQKVKQASGRDGHSSASHDRLRSLGSVSSPLPVGYIKTKARIPDLKVAISDFLHLPNSCSVSSDIKVGGPQGSLKRPNGSVGNKIDATEGTPGCEECRKRKRQKSSDERSSGLQGFQSSPLDDEDNWWVRKGPKTLEPPKVSLPKLTKNPPRVRQKVVRKTQSLAQLAAARIEGSQGATTSHTCDSKIICPHHKTGMGAEFPISTDESRTTNPTNIVTIGKALKHLRFLEKKTITVWLTNNVKQLLEGTEKVASKIGQCTGQIAQPFLVEDLTAARWKLGEDDLWAILYLLDISYDLISAIKFLLWLFSKIPTNTNSTVYGGRSTPMLSKNLDSNVCEVGEAFLLSCIRRYENVVVAADLVPDVLSAMMLRAAVGAGANGRDSASAAFLYARNLLKKYGNVVGVARWEKNFKATSDQRLLSELKSGRALDGEFGFSAGTPAGVEDPDDYFRQKISGRLSRASPNMKQIVQRHVEEALNYFYSKERKLSAAATQRGSGVEKWDGGYQMAQKIVLGLMECIRQSNAVSQEGDPTLVASAVSVIVGSVGPAVAKMLDFTSSSGYAKHPSSMSSFNCTQCILHLHITCLCLLKEALGERHSRVFEIALATEAFYVVAGAYAPEKAPRSQFQLSPDVSDSTMTLPIKGSVKAAAAVSSLVIGVLVRGVVSLERIVVAFRLKEGLDIAQLVKGARSSTNGISRTMGSFKFDNSIEVYVHWFRLLVGNCRTICDGMVADLLGEPYIVALSRMQRMLPLGLVFPPAYSIFSMVIWKPYIPSNNISTREDVQLSLASAIGDAIRHQPFRDLCLRDTYAFYDLLALDAGDSEFAAMLDLQSMDKYLKSTAFVPIRATLFLNAVLDCKMPQSMLKQEEGARFSGHSELKAQHAEIEKKLQDQLVHVLDTLQPAKFHWQWVELRLLLNEQVLIEKIEKSSSTSLMDILRSLSPNTDNLPLSDSESNFTEIVLTRLAVRPDAARLYSEVVHLLGRSMEESLLMNARWFLAGPDVLCGRKSIRQRLVTIAQQRGLSTKIQFWKPWGWSSSVAEHLATKGDKRKFEAISLEEGEVVEEGTDIKRSGKTIDQVSSAEGLNSTQQYVTEKALVELVLPCMGRSSSDSNNTFASDLIKQMNNLDQHINAATRAASKHAGSVPAGTEGATNKTNSRKSIRGGSPGLGRRLTAAAADSAPPSPTALRASMWLRLQFLLRLLPTIYADREPSSRNMRHMLATVILRLLGSRVVHEDADMSFYRPIQNSPALAKREVADSPLQCQATASLDLSDESLFEWFLSIFHGLLSSSKPHWLKPMSSSKSTVKSFRDISLFDRDVVESLQNDLDRMELPEMIRWRLQSAMPVLPSYLPRFVSCQPPSISSAATAALQSSSSISSGAGFLHHGNSNPSSQRNHVPSLALRPTNNPGKSKQQMALLQLDQQEMEIDPWTLLEDGTGSSVGPTLSTSSSSIGGALGLGSNDHLSSSSNNLKACSWLKGAVRVRRTELSYIGAVDDDS